MNTQLVIIIVIAALAIIITAFTFYNTIITKRWRNQVPNEKDYWKLGIFYFNPADSRIFLPKRTGLGWTLNFARPVSVFIISAIIVLAVLAIILKAK